MSADRYQKSAVGVSFTCQGGRHDRCRGEVLDAHWRRRTCTCHCHEGEPEAQRCEHRMKIPHFLGDGSGRMRWTCSDCYADLWMDGS
jgi:hypothetical protein